MFAKPNWAMEENLGMIRFILLCGSGGTAAWNWRLHFGGTSISAGGRTDCVHAGVATPYIGEKT